MLRKRYPDNPEMNAKLAARVPLGRIGLPSDIANIALFLASDESGYVAEKKLLQTRGLFYQDFLPKIRAINIKVIEKGSAMQTKVFPDI